MKHVALAEVTDQLSSLLDDVARGEEITLLRDGKPVARLVPTPGLPTDMPEVSSEEVMKRREAIRALRAMAKARGTDTTQEEIKAWIEEGRH